MQQILLCHCYSKDVVTSVTFVFVDAPHEHFVLAVLESTV